MLLVRLLLKPVPMLTLPLGEGPTFAAVTLPARPVARSTIARMSGTLVPPCFSKIRQENKRRKGEQKNPTVDGAGRPEMFATL